ncbi:phage portal protein [Paracoccus sp. NGMCC 1.201697]|uniref:Phage portal protein n=1 Tax=Paracoccus broussonetiae subsp. drimophilus TaxID=3373869 RepID=A0ABW7LGX5_9RHOB
MKIFGLEITRQKAIAPVQSQSIWRPVIRESYPGAWQQNVEVRQEVVLAYHAVFACMTLIAGDISKLRVKLVAKDSSGIWSETSSPAYTPVLRKPNSYQTRIQFWESWVLSKLTAGNTYALKERDNRSVVVKLHVLDPSRVTPLVSDTGDVYYELQPDNLAAKSERVVVPASEVIHDRFNCLFHPLVGLSPIFASGLAATQGIRIQENSAIFFGNSSMPGGLLIAPGAISDETAQRLKTHWESNYSGKNAGKVAVLGDNLKFESMTTKAVDAQLLEQLKWTAEVVCSTFHVPSYKVGIGDMPTYNNIQALNVEYYTRCLQPLLEAAELCLDEGLGMGEQIGTEFDIDGLLRMDTTAQMDALDKAKGLLTLNERRAKVDQKPKPYGDTIYMQEQDHSAEAIAARDKALIEQSENPQAAEPPSEPTEMQERAFVAETLLAMKKAMEAA